MEKKDFIHLLYHQRERYAEANTNNGWSLWVIFVSIITIIWMLFDNWQNDQLTPPPTINWSLSLLAGIGLFSILFAIKVLYQSLSLSVKRLFGYNLQFYNYRPGTIIFDIVLGVIILFFIFFLDGFFNLRGEGRNIMIMLLIELSIIRDVTLLIQQKYILLRIPWLEIQQIVGDMFLCWGFISLISEYDFLNQLNPKDIKISILVASILCLCYLEAWQLISPLKIKITKIDKLIDHLIIISDDEFDYIDVKNVFEEICFGVKIEKVLSDKSSKLERKFSLYKSRYKNSTIKSTPILNRFKFLKWAYQLNWWRNNYYLGQYVKWNNSIDYELLSHLKKQDKRIKILRNILLRKVFMI